MHPDDKKYIQMTIKACMIACVLAGVVLMIYATIKDCSWKTNMAMIAGMLLILGGGLLKCKYESNEKKFYNN